MPIKEEEIFQLYLATLYYEQQKSVLSPIPLHDSKTLPFKLQD